VYQLMTLQLKGEGEGGLMEFVTKLGDEVG
jgi:hypothetical protein